MTGIMEYLKTEQTRLNDRKEFFEQTGEDVEKVEESEKRIKQIESRIKIMKKILKENGKIKLDASCIKEKILSEMGDGLYLDNKSNFNISTFVPDFQDALDGKITHEQYDERRMESFEREMIKRTFESSTWDIMSVILSQPEKIKITIEFKE